MNHKKKKPPPPPQKKNKNKKKTKKHWNFLQRIWAGLHTSLCAKLLSNIQCVEFYVPLNSQDHTGEGPQHCLLRDAKLLVHPRPNNHF